MNEQEFRKGVKSTYDDVVAGVASAEADSTADQKAAAAADIEERIVAFYDELRQLRTGVIALHETLTRQPFPAEASGMATGEILDHLLAGARELLDRAEREHRTAIDAAAMSARQLKVLMERSDAITRHLAEALVLYTANVDWPVPLPPPPPPPPA